MKTDNRQQSEGFVLVDVIVALMIVTIASISFYSLLQTSLDYARRAVIQYEGLAIANHRIVEYQLGPGLVENSQYGQTENWSLDWEMTALPADKVEDLSSLLAPERSAFEIKKVVVSIKNADSEVVRLSKLIISPREK